MHLAILANKQRNKVYENIARLQTGKGEKRLEKKERLVCQSIEDLREQKSGEKRSIGQ